MTPLRAALSALTLALPLAAAADSASHVLDAAAVVRPERAFAFLVDPSAARAGMGAFEYRAGFGSGLSADRPLPADLTRAGGSHALSASWSVTSRIAPYASATVYDQGSRVNVAAGARVQLTDPASRLRVAVLAGALREAGGNAGVQLTAAASYDAGPVRVAGNVQGEKVFAAGRDALDVLVLAGVSVKVAPAVRLGVEYVGQDLEALVDPEEAEGGARQLVGPTIAFDVDGGRYQLALGGGLGIGKQSPDAMVRARLAVNF